MYRYNQHLNLSNSKSHLILIKRDFSRTQFVFNFKLLNCIIDVMSLVRDMAMDYSPTHLLTYSVYSIQPIDLNIIRPNARIFAIIVSMVTNLIEPSFLYNAIIFLVFATR